MTAVLEEARRMLRLARRDQAAFEALLPAPGVGVAVATFMPSKPLRKP
jgi:hypothetical protein